MARYAKSLGFAERAEAPATPATGNIEMYLMDDGKLYKKDDTGTESEVGGGIMGEGTAISGTSGNLTVVMDGAVKHFTPTGDSTLTLGEGTLGQMCTIVIFGNYANAYSVNFYGAFADYVNTGTMLNAIWVTLVCAMIGESKKWLEIGRKTISLD